MSSFNDLLRRLDAAEPAGWEEEYARFAVELTRDQAFEVVRSERAYADWFTFRFDAGPPGVPLPTSDAALDAVLLGKQGSPLDAYRVVFASPPLADEVPGELLLALLCNATVCASKGGASWFATWLAARAGLAAIALSAPQRAWSILDGFTFEGGRHPNLEKLALFEPLRHSESAQRSPWVRAAICRLWPRLGVPVLPSLPFPDLAAEQADLDDTLDELSRIGAVKPRALVQSFADAMVMAGLERHADDPLVRELRKRAVEGNLEAPTVDRVPEWFLDWARAVGRSGDAHLARLAGLVVRAVDSDEKQLVAMLVLPAARAQDLEILAEGLDAPELQPLFAELTSARELLPVEAADALVATALPRHVRHGQALGVLAQHVEQILGLGAPPGGAVDNIATMLRTMVEERQRDHTRVRPILEQLMAEVHREAGQLTTAGRRLSAADVERAATKVTIPKLTIGLLETAAEAAADLPALHQLLLALALRRAVEDTEHNSLWEAPLAKVASDSIYTLREPQLFELRLRLLDEAIEAAHAQMPIAELYFQRANTRRASSAGDERETQLVLGDLNMAIRRARAEANPGLCAAATAAWVKTLVSSALTASDGSSRSYRVAEGETAIADALDLPLGSRDAAVLHQARAHLARLDDPEKAVVAFESALAQLGPEMPLWAEIAAELVQTLLRAGRVDDAVERGTEYLERARGDSLWTELGMLHLALGEALVVSRQLDDAKRRLESGLQLVRGRDTSNEALARLHLAHLGLATGDEALTDEHLRFLRDHRGELDPLTRRDVDLLEAAAVAARGDTAQQRAVLARTLSTVKEERMRVGLRLEIARLDLVAGHPVHDLDALVRAGLRTDLDGHYDAVLTDLLCNHGEALASATREEALHWARQRRPRVVARLQHQAGETEAARATLRGVLAGDLDDRERLACTQQLMTLLESEEHTERRTLCAELERLLDVVEDVPHVRLDLAAGMWMTAGDEVGLILRARAHARRAIETPLSPREREFGHRTIARTTIDLLRLSLPLSSPSLAHDATFLGEELALGEPEASQLRLVAASFLLLPGPLTHPDAVSVAGRLLDLVTAPPDARAFGALVERLRWLRDRNAFTAAISPTRVEPRGPFDALPGWLVDHVHGRSETIAPDELARAAGDLERVVQARPDVADRLLALAISVQAEVSEELRQELLDAVYLAVQSAGLHRNESWARLREALANVQKQHRHPMLSNIESATGRTSVLESREPKVPEANDVRPFSTTEQVGSRERAADCFERGVAMMESLHGDRHADDALLRISASRAHLKEAVAIAEEQALPELFDFLVSYGNALKMSPGEDVEGALRIYESAAMLESMPEQKAKLWKVQADVLLLRGAEDDLRHADRLLERSCRVRRGPLLAESLMSRARVALVHPDLDDADRERTVSSFAMDAVRAHRGFGDQDGVVSFLLNRLSAWERKLPNDPTPARIRNELKTFYPARAAQIDALVPRLTGREIDVVVAVMMHPAGKAYMEVRSRLMPRSERGRDFVGLIDQFGPSARKAVTEQMERDSLLGHPDRAEEVLSSLAAAPDDVARPGRLAARVMLLAYLARTGRRPVSEVRSATVEAVNAISDVEELLVRTALLQGIAVTWSPGDQSDDPVRDFAFAAELLRRCVELEGGEATAVDDTLALLARALRYSPVGDLQANLREARRLYSICLERARVAGGPDVIANLLHNLADVESQMGTGSRLERIRAAERRLEDAVATAQSPHKKAHFTANLAWERTQIGTQIGGAEGGRYLEKALATFDEVDLSLLDEHGRRNVEGNRSVCEATLARLVGGPGAEIASWREYLAKLDGSVAPYSVAIAKHNLANALMFSGDVTREALAEGLRLSREAAEVRTHEANPRHHWETSLNIGRALLGALASGRHDLLPLPPEQAEAEARLWLHRAVAAARTLGPGEELLDAAFSLGALASRAPTPERFIEEAEEVWTHVHEASAYLLLDPQSREREALAATGTAAQLAYRLAQRSLAVPSRGLAFVLHGESARLVERWIVRAQQPARRPLQARLSRPENVSASEWDAWRSAVDSRDQRRMADALYVVREAVPSFLAEDHANDVTWAWLEARPGSVAVALVLAEPVSLALLMQAGGAGERKTWILGLELEPPPLPLDTLAGLMRSAVPDASAHAALDGLAQWTRQGVVEPIVQFLGVPPSTVLWSPDPGLRLVAPSAVWRSVPVVGATSLVLSDLSSAPSRRRSSLVVLADPGPETQDPRLDLRGQGVRTLETLELAAARRGPVRLLGSVGERFGRTLLGERSVVRDTPASARDVLLEAAEHETVILVAHGEVETIEDAAVLCLDASGSIDRLDVAQLGRSPDAFAGATVLLLSCEGGRMGDSLVEPGGLAGTLLAAGAACVVAPLWPVRLDAAEQVGRAVLDGIASGDEPWAVLAKLNLHEDGNSPMLGRPAPSLSERRAEQALQRLAFVAWVG